MAGESAREVARKAREKARRLERRAELFERGADGETRTADVLASLPGGWLTIHDVAWPSRRLANIDHVLIGPGGIFVIDSKNWSGRITLDRGRLRQNGRSRERSVTGCAEAARAVAALAGRDADKVLAVLCFTGQEGLTGRCGDVLVCSEDTLVEMLLSGPVLLDHAAAMDAWLRLDTQLRAGRTVTGPRAAGAPRSRAARPRKKRPSLISALLGLMLLFGFAVFGPDLARNVGDVVADYMTRDLHQPQVCGDPDADRPNADLRERQGEKGQGEKGQGEKGQGERRPDERRPDERRQAKAEDC